MAVEFWNRLDNYSFLTTIESLNHRRKLFVHSQFGRLPPIVSELSSVTTKDTPQRPESADLADRRKRRCSAMKRCNATSKNMDNDSLRLSELRTPSSGGMASPGVDM